MNNCVQSQMGNSINLKDITGSDIILFETLTLDYKPKPFDCKKEDLNDFLFVDSKIYLKHLAAKTYILETDIDTIAYYSLSNDLLLIQDIEDFRYEIKDCHFDPKYESFFFDQRSYPAVKIGRFAINKKYQRKGIGRFLMNSIRYGFIEKNKTGCQFITVDALNEPCVIAFYEKMGFHLLTVYDVNKPSRQMWYCLLEDTELGVLSCAESPV